MTKDFPYPTEKKTQEIANCLKKVRQAPLFELFTGNDDHDLVNKVNKFVEDFNATIISHSHAVYHYTDHRDNDVVEYSVSIFYTFAQ